MRQFHCDTQSQEVEGDQTPPKMSVEATSMNLRII